MAQRSRGNLFFKIHPIRSFQRLFFVFLLASAACRLCKTTVFGPASRLFGTFSPRMGNRQTKISSNNNNNNIHFQMLSVVDNISTLTPLTFPVRMSKLSFHPLALLLSLERNTSLTVWSGPRDPTNFNELIQLHLSFPGRLYFDLPAETDTQFRQKLKESRLVSYIFVVLDVTLCS